MAIGCLSGSVGRTRENITLIFLRSALLVQIMYATFIFVTIEKNCALFFIKHSPFCIIVFPFYLILSLW